MHKLAFNKWTKITLTRAFSILLVLILAFCLMPTTAHATIIYMNDRTFQVGVERSSSSATTNATWESPAYTGTLPGGILLLPDGSGGLYLKGTALPGTVGYSTIKLKDGTTADMGITIERGPQTIVQGNISKKMSDSNFTVAPHSTNGSNATIPAGSTDAPTYQFSAGTDPTVATINATTGAVTILKPGTTTVTITSGATNSYTAATNNNMTFDIVVAKADPVISASNQTAVLGTAKTVTATLADAYLAGTDSISFTATSGGVTIPATAPTTANGSFSFDLSAADINTLGLGTHTFTVAQTGTAGNTTTNNNTVANATFDLTINGAAPTITSANNYTCTAGTGGTFQVTATGNPSTFTYSLTGQPTGVSIDPNTGRITVANTVAASTYNFTVGADNGVAPAASQAFTLTVQQQNNTDADTDYIIEFIPRTIMDKQTGVAVSGEMTSGARLIVQERALHTEGACPACDEIRARQAAGELIVLYDISISGGYTGELEVSIPVGEQYNGQTVTILHCVNGVLESITCVVQNGVAKGTFKKLSPFAVVQGASVSVPTETVVDPPKTGDAGGYGMAGVALVLGALGLGAVVRKKRSTNS